MRIVLWALGAPLLVAAAAWLAMWAMAHGTGHPVDDTAYWGTAISWIVNAAWVAGAIGTLIGVVLGPAVVVVRRLRRHLAATDAKRRNDPAAPTAPPSRSMPPHSKQF